MRYSFICRLLVGAVFASAAVLPAAASELVGAAPLSGLNGLQVDNSTGSLQQPFTSLVSGTVESIVWWGFHGTDSKGENFDNFIVLLNEDDQTGELTKTVDQNGLTRYELDIVDTPLVAGVSGTLDIVNDSEEVEWFWQYSDVASETVAYSLQGTAAVPEPATYALVLIALAGMTACRQRKA